MAEKLHFSMVSPERELVSADVEMVVVPGSEGDFGVLIGHAPVISRLRPGVVDVFEEANGTPTKYFVYHGFAEVNAAGLTVLAEDAQPLAELDGQGIDQKIKNAEEDVSIAKDDFEKALAEENLSHLRAVKEVVSAA